MTDDQPETGGATEQGRFGDEPWRPARETRAQRQWRTRAQVSTATTASAE